MLTKELATVVARVALTMTDSPTPTTKEILAALTAVAEESDRIGFARGVIAGTNTTVATLDRVMLKMAGEPA